MRLELLASMSVFTARLAGTWWLPMGKLVYTDYLGNSVAVGDTIVYPKCSGSSSADLNMAVIAEILPIIPRDPSDPACRSGYLWSDRKLRYPPYRAILRGDLSKAYILKVKRTRDGSGNYKIWTDRLVTLSNVDRIVVVTSVIDN
jgi:hypothetical protein